MLTCSLAHSEPKRGPQPSIPLFTPPQQQALRSWNEILVSLNLSCASDNYLSPQLIANNRLAAFQLFKVGHGEEALSALADAFKATRGHWVNGERPAQSIPMIIAHMNNSLLHSIPGLERYRSNTAKMESRPQPAVRPKGRSAANTVCLVHPGRKTVARELCSGCYAKAFRLNLLHLPLGKWMVTLLKKRKPRDASRCVNHAQVASYADGLCVECLQRVGRLEDILGVGEVCFAN